MVGYPQIFVKRKFLVYSFILVLLGLLTYYPALHAGFVLDDEGQIVNNEIIKSLSRFPLFFTGGTFYGGDLHKLIGGFYRPIMSIVYALIYAVAGMNPFPYHIFSVLLHCANAVLVYVLLRWVLKPMKDSPLPFLLSALFVVHPMLVSGVAYVAAVNEPLFFFFGMTGLLLIIYIPFTITTLIASMLLFFLGLLSKETTILCIVTAYIYLYLFDRKKTTSFLISTIILMISYLVLRCGVAHMCDGRTGIGPLAVMSLDKYILHVPAIIFFYLYTFVLPINLAISQEWIIREATLSTFYLPLLACISFGVACLGYLFYFYYQSTNQSLLDRKKTNDATRLPKTWVLTLSMLALGLLMHIHIIPLDFTVDEHWFYFSMAGLMGMIGIFIMKFIHPKQRVYAYLTLCIVIGLLAYRTYVRANDWHDNYRLFSHDVRYSTESAALYNNLATEMFRKKKYQEAERYFIHSTTLDLDRPVAWTNLGIIAELDKRYGDAETYYLTAVGKGNYYKAYELYAALLLRQGKKDKARTFLKEKAIPLFPKNQVLQELYKMPK